MRITDNYSTVRKIMDLTEGQFEWNDDSEKERKTILIGDSLAGYVCRLLARGFYTDDLAYYYETGGVLLPAIVITLLSR